MKKINSFNLSELPGGRKTSFFNVVIGVLLSIFIFCSFNVLTVQAVVVNNQKGQIKAHYSDLNLTTGTVKIVIDSFFVEDTYIKVVITNQQSNTLVSSAHIDTKQITSTNSAELSAVLSGIQNDADYIVFVDGRHSDIKGDFSQEDISFNFTTKIKPDLSVSDLKTTSFVVNVVGLSPTKTYEIKVQSAGVSTSGNSSQELKVVADSGGKASATFATGITEKSSYLATIRLVDTATGSVGSPLTAPLTIDTPSLITFTSSNITDTSVSFSATGLSPNGTYQFTVKHSSGAVLNLQATTNASGQANVAFAGLTQNSSYTGSVSRYFPATATQGSPVAPIINFKTLATSVTPPANSSNNSSSSNNNSTFFSNTNNSETQAPDEGSGLVPCTENCNFYDALTLINNIVNFVLFKLVIPIAAIMFAYAGILLLFSGGNSEQMSKAKSIFINVAIGFVIACIAWLLITTILDLVGFKGDRFGFKVAMLYN